MRFAILLSSLLTWSITSIPALNLDPAHSKNLARSCSLILIFPLSVLTAFIHYSFSDSVHRTFFLQTTYHPLTLESGDKLPSMVVRYVHLAIARASYSFSTSHFFHWDYTYR